MYEVERMSELALQITRKHAAISRLIQSLLHIPVQARKVLLTQTRCQSTTKRETRFLARCREQLLEKFTVVILGKIEVITLLSLSHLMDPYLTPIGSSILSCIIRMTPYVDNSSLLEEMQNGIKKELSAALGMYHPVALNYSSIFSREGVCDEGLAPNLINQPSLQHSIQKSLLNAVFNIQRTLLLPRLSKKTPGHLCQLNAHPVTHELATYGDLEKVYHTQGIMLQGPTECRIAFKYNDLKPRIYYAQGSSCFHASKYIQAIFNHLVDSLDSTNRFLRFAPETMTTRRGDLAFIYDYSAFTSSLHEIRNFTTALGNFLINHVITVFDTLEGKVHVSLGKLILDYNQTCNISPDFDVSQIYDLTESLLLYHNCGMLGVPGNISSCTLLHGIHLIIILGSLSCGKVVGDDAIGRFVEGESYTRVTMVDALSNIGILQMAKVEWFEPKDIEEFEEDDSWNYVKRPIYRIEDRLIFGHMLTFPSIASALGFDDNVHTEHPGNRFQRVKRYGAQVFRFWSSVLSLPDKDEISISLAEEIFRYLHKMLKITISGHSADFPHRFIPPAYFAPDFLDIMVDNKFGHVIDFPIFEGEEVAEFKKGSRWRGKSHPGLSLLESLGYVERNMATRTILVDDFAEEIIAYFRDKTKFHPRYDFLCVKTLPEFMYDCLPSSYAHIPWPSNKISSSVENILEELGADLTFSSDSE